MLTEKIDKDIIGAMKSQEAVKLGVLRMMKTALKLKQVETGRPLEDEQAQAVLRMLVKQRREAAEMFRQGGRSELAAKELAEIGVIEAYLPTAATEAEIEEAATAAIRESGAASSKDVGKVMKAAMAKLAGKTVDGKLLSEKVRAKLAG